MSTARLIHAPDDTISVGPTEVDVIYEQHGGEELLSLLINTARVGHFSIAFTVDEVRAVIANLSMMVDNLEHLRAEWARHNELGEI
ncbi:hypothetical protein [Mycobacterium sp. 1423905.2]|uniref:hypothetical protein n=1 Tax=Mycobacterium sp. 1423905.2 TaxID=1856859 RepID=UPI000800C369|nr:hypothetical protein [Mycobacterium sp. 1423905.2]OBJ49540.1 hypothetical protein A9W95_25585 [Mycobacterium sp. 1423905.2]